MVVSDELSPERRFRFYTRLAERMREAGADGIADAALEQAEQAARESPEILAEITRAMVNGASILPRSATLSTSSPIMVSRSTMAASGASVSRCSFSQARVNFIIMRTRDLSFPLCAGEAQQA